MEANKSKDLMPFGLNDLLLLGVAIAVLAFLAKRVRQRFEPPTAPAIASDDEAVADLPAEVQKKIEDGFYRLGDMVLLSQFDSIAEAAIIRGLLLSQGLFATLGDEQIGTMKFQYAQAIGGIKLYVHEKEYAAASQVLAEHREIDSGEGEDWQIQRCPKCNSETLSFQRFHPAGILPLIFGAPIIPVRSNRWVCLSCGHKWKEEKIKA